MSSVLSIVVSLLLLTVVGGLVVLWVWMLIEALKTPAATWEAAGQNQLIYILLMIFLGIIGTVAYYFVARPALRATARPA